MVYLKPTLNLSMSGIFLENLIIDKIKLEDIQKIHKKTASIIFEIFIGSDWKENKKASNPFFQKYSFE